MGRTLQALFGGDNRGRQLGGFGLLGLIRSHRKKHGWEGRKEIRSRRQVDPFKTPSPLVHRAQSVFFSALYSIV